MIISKIPQEVYTLFLVFCMLIWTEEYITGLSNLC